MAKFCPECGDLLLSQFKCSCGWRSSKEHGDQGQFNPLCSAYGCPLPGSLSQDTRGTQGFVCFIHYQAPPGQWQEITHRLRNQQLELVELVTLVRQIQNGKLVEIRQVLQTISDPDFLPGDRERRENGRLSMRRWGVRLEEMLRQRVTEGLSHEQPHGYSSSEHLMSMADEFMKSHTMG